VKNSDFQPCTIQGGPTAHSELRVTSPPGSNRTLSVQALVVSTPSMRR
jgi:hypothetical protein